MVSPIRAIFRITIYFSLTLLLIPVQAAALGLSRGLAARVPLTYHRWCCRILGFDVKVSGQLSRCRPTLYVSNHASYLDISALASVVPGSFIAKSEVASWPFFGLLAKLQRTVFIERRSGRTAEQRDAIIRFDAEVEPLQKGSGSYS